MSQYPGSVVPLAMFHVFFFFPLKGFFYIPLQKTSRGQEICFNHFRFFSVFSNFVKLNFHLNSICPHHHHHSSSTTTTTTTTTAAAVALLTPIVDCNLQLQSCCKKWSLVLIQEEKCRSVDCQLRKCGGSLLTLPHDTLLTPAVLQKKKCGLLEV